MANISPRPLSITPVYSFGHTNLSSPSRAVHDHQHGMKKAYAFSSQASAESAFPFWDAYWGALDQSGFGMNLRGLQPQEDPAHCLGAFEHGVPLANEPLAYLQPGLASCYTPGYPSYFDGHAYEANLVVDLPNNNILQEAWSSQFEDSRNVETQSTFTGLEPDLGASGHIFDSFDPAIPMVAATELTTASGPALTRSLGGILEESAPQSNSEEILRCPRGCPGTFRRPGDYRRHMRKHEKPRYKCPDIDCKKTFYRADKLRDHIRQGHKGLGL